MFICQNVLLHVHCTCIIMKHFFTKLVKQFWKYSPLWYWQVCPSDTLMLLMEKLIRSIQCQRSQRKTFLWKRRALKTKNRPCQKTTPFIYWWSGFPRVFLPFAVLCRKSYCIDQDVHYQAILSRKSCTNLSFSPDAVLMSIRSCFLVIFEGLLLEKEKSARFALPMHLQILQWGHELLQCRSGHLLSQKVYLCPSWQSDQPWHVMRTILPASIFDQLIPYNSCTERMWIL